MTPEVPENLDRHIRSQLAAWMAELDILRSDPKVRDFLNLQERISQTDAFLIEASAPPLLNRSTPFDPYDAFEFARDLSGKEVSSVTLSKLAYGRFPDLSDAGRQLMVHFLIDNGFAVVAQRTTKGLPTWYRFAPPGNGGTKPNRDHLGIPSNELSALKREDLEDVVALHHLRQERG